MQAEDRDITINVDELPERIRRQRARMTATGKYLQRWGQSKKEQHQNDRHDRMIYTEAKPDQVTHEEIDRNRKRQLTTTKEASRGKKNKKQEYFEVTPQAHRQLSDAERKSLRLVKNKEKDKRYSLIDYSDEYYKTKKYERLEAEEKERFTLQEQAPRTLYGGLLIGSSPNCIEQTYFQVNRYF